MESEEEDEVDHTWIHKLAAKARKRKSVVPFLPNGTTLNSPYFRISNASLLIITCEAAL